jgi:hypothetical protein
MTNEELLEHEQKIQEPYTDAFLTASIFIKNKNAPKKVDKPTEAGKHCFPRLVRQSWR